MRLANRVYLALTIVFAASLLAVLILHRFSLNVVAALASVPAIGALFGALFQLARDQLAFERTIRIEEAKNQFTIGAMSHMANTAFDRHVSFCEEYLTSAYALTAELLRRGPHAEAINGADELARTRIRWGLWLSPEVSKSLEKFEDAIREIGSNKWLAQELEPGDDRHAALNAAYRKFAEVMGFERWRGEPITEELTTATVLQNLRTILGVEKLARLRTELINRAAQSVE